MLRVLTFLYMYLIAHACFSQDWEGDFSVAQENSRQQHKYLLVVFSGSDWCIPCMKLERNIWKSKAFKEYASKELVLYRADFPQKKKNRLPKETMNSNKKLAEIYNTKGYFPLVVLLDSDGTTLGKLGYEKVSPERYIKKIESLYP